MVKQLQFKLMLLLCALVAGSGSVWATDAEFLPSNFSGQGTSGSGSAISATVSGVTFACNKGYGTTQIRCYSGSKITISSSSIITGISFTFSESYTGGMSTSYTNLSTTKWEKTLSSQARITAVTVTYYAITPAVNDETMGSVTISDNKITATPNAGHRVKSGDEGYTVTSGTATVVNNNNNTFTVTPSTDCTVQINFEALPSHTLSSIISPTTDAGTVMLGSATINEGATTTATAVANAGYKFTGWSISGTGASLSSTSTNPTTVTMGTADATISANFEAVTTHAITYSVNGITNTVNVEENTAVDLSAPTSGVPVGYEFQGWAEEALNGTQSTAPTYVTSATSTENITYYAIMAAVESKNQACWTLDYSNETSLSSSTSWGSYGTAYSYTTTDGGTWVIKAYKSSGMQINTGKNSSIKVPSCSGNIQSIAITCSAAKAVGFSESDYSGSGTITYLAEGSNATSQTLDLSNRNVTVGYIVPKGGSTSITKIVVNYEQTVYAYYCTTAPTATITLASACNDGEGNYYGTYSNSQAFVVPEGLTVSEINVVNETLAITNYNTGDIVPANTGVMVSAASDGNKTVTLAAGGTSKLGSDNMLKASGTGIDDTAMETAAPNCFYYRLTMHNNTTIGFYWGEEDGAAFDVAANKAYLAVPKPQAARISGFSLFGDGEATGISATLKDNGEKDNTIYNLNGQRVSKPTKGLYIVNGKKTMVK